MGQIRRLIEDAFQDKVDMAFKQLKGHMPVKLEPSYFDRDALQLGVLYELSTGKDFAKALYYAMFKLSRNPHMYDNVDDYGGINQNTVNTNQITWSGAPQHVMRSGY